MIPIRYNIRSLQRRKATSIATAAGIGLVVFVLAATSMLSSGIQKTLASSGREGIAIVLRKGADAELASVIEREHVDTVFAVPGVDRVGNDQPAGAGELVALMAMRSLVGNRMVNVTVRGVTEYSIALRTRMAISEGRAPKPGTDEAIVGKRLRGRFAGLALGESFDLRKNRPVRIVGVFEDEGSAYESEVWADSDTVRTAFGREGLVSSIRVRLANAASFEPFRSAIEQDRRLAMQVLPEREFYQRQSQGTSTFIGTMGTLIGVFFAIAAIIGAMITMNTTVAKRRREVGTLRALGFSRQSIIASLILESCVLAIAGGLVGAAAALAMGFVKISMMNYATWCETTFGFQPSIGIVGYAVFVSIVVGLFGGLIPAIRAARVPAVVAMRE